MFTFTKFTTDEVNLDLRRRILVAEFVDGDKQHYQKFEFTVNESPENIKKRVKQYLDDEVNFVPEAVTDIDVVEVVTEKTAEELEKEQFEADKAEWLKKKEVLSTMIKDMEQAKALGITPDETQTTIMKGLADWINANMKQEYYF